MYLGDAKTTAIGFCLFAIILNVTSNLSRNRSYSPIFFLQILYQISYDAGINNEFWKFMGIVFNDFSQTDSWCLNGANCRSSFIFSIIIAGTLILLNIWALYSQASPIVEFNPNNTCNMCISIGFNILLSIFEWIQIPMIITPLYLFRYNNSTGELIVASVFSFCIGISCYLLNILIYWKKCMNGNDKIIFFYQKLVNIYFLCFSFSVLFMKQSLVVVQTVSWSLLAFGAIIIIFKFTSSNRVGNDNGDSNNTSKRQIILKIRLITYFLLMVLFSVLVDVIKNYSIVENNDSIIVYLILAVDAITLFIQIIMEKQQVRSVSSEQPAPTIQRAAQHHSQEGVRISPRVNQEVNNQNLSHNIQDNNSNKQVKQNKQEIIEKKKQEISRLNYTSHGFHQKRQKRKKKLYDQQVQESSHSYTELEGKEKVTQMGKTFIYVEQIKKDSYHD